MHSILSYYETVYVNSSIYLSISIYPQRNVQTTFYQMLTMIFFWMKEFQVVNFFPYTFLYCLNYLRMSSYQFYFKNIKGITLNKKIQWQDSTLGREMDRETGHQKLNRTLGKSVTVKLLWATVFLSRNEKMRKLNVVSSKVYLSTSMR